MLLPFLFTTTCFSANRLQQNQVNERFREIMNNSSGTYDSSRAFMTLIRKAKGYLLHEPITTIFALQFFQELQNQYQGPRNPSIYKQFLQTYINIFKRKYSDESVFHSNAFHDGYYIRTLLEEMFLLGYQPDVATYAFIIGILDFKYQRLFHIIDPIISYIFELQCFPARFEWVKYLRTKEKYSLELEFSDLHYDFHNRVLTSSIDPCLMQKDSFPEFAVELMRLFWDDENFMTEFWKVWKRKEQKGDCHKRVSLLFLKVFDLRNDREHVQEFWDWQFDLTMKKVEKEYQSFFEAARTSILVIRDKLEAITDQLNALLEHAGIQKTGKYFVIETLLRKCIDEKDFRFVRLLLETFSENIKAMANDLNQAQNIKKCWKPLYKYSIQILCIVKKSAENDVKMPHLCCLSKIDRKNPLPSVVVGNLPNLHDLPIREPIKMLKGVLDFIPHGECAVCMEGKVNTVIAPCGHSLCYGCAQKMKNRELPCHYCRGPIAYIWQNPKMFLSEVECNAL